MSVRDKYNKIRGAARVVVASEFNGKNPTWQNQLRLEPIDDLALNYLSELWRWSPDPNKQVGDPESWNYRVATYKKSKPMYVDLAIWFGSDLTALMLGKISRGKTIVTMNFIEGNSAKTPLQNQRLNICTAYAKLIAQQIGAKGVVVSKPVPTAIPLYQSLGFQKLNKRNLLELSV